MKQILIILLIFIYQFAFCQQKDDNDLNKAIREYEVCENNDIKDSLWNTIINTYEKQLLLKDFGKMKTQIRYNENSLGYEFITLRQYHSENEIFTAHSLSNGFGHWNYVTQKNINGTNKIILKKTYSSDYYSKIHELNEKEFLLITRFDDMSYSCYDAYVMKVLDNGIIRQDAFVNKQDVFSVCSWTNVDESYPGKKDSTTGLYNIEGGMKYYEPIEIIYNPKNKIISYVFYSLKDGKKVIRKAKYKNGEFKIKDYDARTFEE